MIKSNHVQRRGKSMTIRLYKRLGLYLYCYGDEHLITHFEQVVGIKRKEPVDWEFFFEKLNLFQIHVYVVDAAKTKKSAVNYEKMKLRLKNHGLYIGFNQLMNAYAELEEIQKQKVYKELRYAE